MIKISKLFNHPVHRIGIMLSIILLINWLQFHTTNNIVIESSDLKSSKSNSERIYRKRRKLQIPDDYNIIFYKTHKTGSSSIQNIIYRLALKHNLPIIWDKKTGNTDLRYPSPFEIDFIINKPNTARISTAHMRPTDDIYKSFDNNYINFEFTILRHPFANAQSSYSYFHDRQDLKVCYEGSSNFTDFLQNYQQLSKQQFMIDQEENPNFPYLEPYCFNPMSYDLGFRKTFLGTDEEMSERDLDSLLPEDSDFKRKEWEKSEIQEIISQLDQKLNLVLIFEHYHESMIMLKDYLNLSFDDIVTFQINRIAQDDEKLSVMMGYDINEPEAKENHEQEYKPKMKELQPIDSAIYAHFYKKFVKIWKEDYGEEKMSEEVEILKMKTKELYDQCEIIEKIPSRRSGTFSTTQNVPKYVRPWHPRYIKTTALLTKVNQTENPELFRDCMLHTMPEISMGTFVRKKQIEDGLIDYIDDWDEVKAALRQYTAAEREWGIEQLVDSVLVN